MRVIERHATRLVLGGIPHGAGWPTLGVAMGILFASVFGTLCARHLGQSQWYAASMTALGTGLGVLFLVVCADILLQRERLELDRTLQRGAYRLSSLIRGEIKSFEFPLERVAGVSLERFMQSTGGKSGFPVRALRARLLLDKPRRAILLDETQNQKNARIESIAGLTAEFLGVEPKRSGGWNGD